MKLVSVTITSDTREATIGAALRSAIDWVDEAIVLHLVDPGGTPDRTLDIAREVCGDRLRIVDFNMAGKNMADFRNEALAVAFELGADWVLMLDSNKPMRANGAYIKAELDSYRDKYTSVSVTCSNGGYYKPMFFHRSQNGNAYGSFVGGYHEEWRSNGVSGLMPKVRFDETPKSKERIAQDLETHLAGIEAQIENDPYSWRWRYYSGFTLERMGNTHGAIRRYNEAISIGDNEDEVAWTWFSLARALYTSQAYELSERACIEGLAIHPDWPEFACLAGWARYAMHDSDRAIAWATMAQSQSWMIKPGIMAFCRDLYGCYEGPWDLLNRCGVEWANESDVTRARLMRTHYCEGNA